MNGAPEIVSIILAVTVPAGVLVAGVFAWLFKDNLSSLRTSIAQQTIEISNVKAKLGDHEITLAKYGEARIGSDRDLDELRSDMREVKTSLSKLNETVASLVTLMKSRSFSRQNASDPSL
ncbi:MAG: hypothetical protein WCL08_10085 [Verrucomicrobiota bacterium]